MFAKDVEVCLLAFFIDCSQPSEESLRQLALAPFRFHDWRMGLARRIAALKPSATLTLNARAAEMRRQGRRVISLAVGEPDLPPPPAAIKAGHEALAEGFTRYTPAAGIPELREAVARMFREELGLAVAAEQVVITAGGKQALFNLMLALLGEGDEVIIPAPYWVSYPEMAKLAGARPVIVPTRAEDGFRLRPEALDAAITPRTRLFVLNSPSNPTGMRYTREELAALAEVLRAHPSIWIASDEIYRKILFDGVEHVSIVQVAPDLAARTVIVDGASKAYRMTGLRIGFAAGPAEIIRAMIAIQGQSTSNPCSIAQRMALAAITSEDDGIAEMNRIFQRRRDRVVETLGAVPGVHLPVPEGAFYAFPDLAAALPANEDDARFCERLLEEEGVAVVPGSAFGAPGCVRISFAVAEAELEEALARIVRALGA